LSAEEAGRGGVSTRLLIGVLVSGVFVSVLNNSMVNVVVPVIGQDYGATEAQVGWVITGFLLAFAVGIPLYGRAADVFSVRSAFVAGLATFAVGSLVCALAPTLWALVLGRIVQGAGGAAIPALASVDRRSASSSPASASGAPSAPFSAGSSGRSRAGTPYLSRPLC
jgi:MFS family permease